MRNWIIVVCAILAISVFQFAGTVTAADDTSNVIIIAAGDEQVEVETDEGAVEEGEVMEEGTDEEVPAEEGDAATEEGSAE